MAPGVIWLTGLSGAGKSTLAYALAAGLCRHGIDNLTVLDGEEVRARLSRCYGHSLEQRGRVLRHIVDMAQQEIAAERNVIVATISHQRWMREYARARLSLFLEVFLDCPVEVCAARDEKDHFRRAMRGEYDCFIGVTHPYERSEQPDLVIETGRLGVAEASGQLLRASLAFFATARAGAGTSRGKPSRATREEAI